MSSALPIADVPDARRRHLFFPETVAVDTVGLGPFAPERWREPAQGAGIAACCHAAYHDHAAAGAAYAALGWRLERRIDEAGVRVDRLASDHARLLCCCGTRPREVENLRHDADAVLVSHPRGGRVHRGFLRASTTLADHLAAPAHDPRPCFAAGHSLGGALAILAAVAWDLPGAVAFGCPRVGDPAFVAAVAGTPVIRYHHATDVVGHLPPQRLGFAHLGLLRYLAPGGGTWDDPPRARLHRSQWWAKVRYALRQPWLRPGALWFRELADHAVHNYRAALGRRG